MKLKVGAKPFNLILLGDPGAGKATQTAYLAKKYGMYDFDMGEELAKMRLIDSKFDSLCKKTIDQGKLAPTSIVTKLYAAIIPKIPKNQGIVFDGHPRMVPEAKFVINLLKKSGRSEPLVVYLHINHREMYKRLKNRKGYSSSKNKKRADDSPKAIVNRLKYYKTEVQNTLAYFGKHYSTAGVDGLGSKVDVKKRFEKVIKHYLFNYKDFKSCGMVMHYNDKSC